MSIGISYKYLKPLHKRFGNLEINTKPIMHCCIVSLSWVNFRQNYRQFYPYRQLQPRTGKTGYIQPHALLD